MAYDPLLSIDGLTVRKGHATLLDNVSLTLEAGRFYGILGPNGAGKSTLLKTLYRAQRTGADRIAFEGRRLDAWPRRDYAAKVGALVQEQVSLAGLTLLEVVRLGLLPARLPAQEQDHRSRAALSMVGLGGWADRLAERLSGGEQQRVFFAQLLALDPDLYLLDEPHNHLDLHFQYALLRRIKAAGRTVLASFHDLSLAARFCDHLFLLDRGTLVAQGAPETVLTPERLAQVYRIEAELTDGLLRVSGEIPGGFSGHL